jgi:predicted phage terminase large subunit-like protein
MDPAAAETITGVKKNRPCFTVAMFVDQTPQYDIIIRHVYRKVASAPETIDNVQELYNEHEIPWIGVEDNGIGLPMIQMMQRRGMAVRSIHAVRNYISRAEGAEVKAKQGQIYLREGADWVGPFLAEIERFPVGDYVDQVDCLAHVANEVGRTDRSRLKENKLPVVSHSGAMGIAVGVFGSKK